MLEGMRKALAVKLALHGGFGHCLSLPTFILRRLGRKDRPLGARSRTTQGSSRVRRLGTSCCRLHPILLLAAIVAGLGASTLVLGRLPKLKCSSRSERSKVAVSSIFVPGSSAKP